VLQCVAVCGSALQSVAVSRHSLLQYDCVAACCSVETHRSGSTTMGWIRLVGSLKSYVSFAKEPYKRDDILQKRPIILRSLLHVATPYIDAVLGKQVERQCVAVWCNVVQCVAVCWWPCRCCAWTAGRATVCCSVLQYVAVWCRVLQSVAVHYSVLQCVEDHVNVVLGEQVERYCVAVCCSVLQCAAVRCSVLQCVAVCCSVLQCVAVCCSVLQRVAVCCSVLQCVAVSWSVETHYSGSTTTSILYWESRSNMLQSAGTDSSWYCLPSVVCCSVGMLQCDAVCCSELLCAVGTDSSWYCLPSVVCFSVGMLQCDAVCCSAL